jgi:hypothetical protein
MADRQRVRVGRGVTYFPTDVEAAAAGDDNGASWPATIAKVLPDGTANLRILSGDGAADPVLGVARGIRKGEFDLTGGDVAHHA